MIDPHKPLSLVLVAVLVCVLHAQDVVLFPQPEVPGIVATDVNGDGIPDSIDRGYEQIEVRLGQGNGLFGPPTIVPGPGPVYELLVGDVTGDGQADILAALDTGAIDVYPAVKGGFGPAVESYIGFVDLQTLTTLADMTGDGIPDLVAVYPNNPYGESYISVAVSDGAGGFGPPLPDYSSDLLWGLAIGDFDGDGALDVGAGTSDGKRVEVSKGLGTGLLDSTWVSTSLHALSPISGTELAATDFDGDGLCDLVAVVKVNPPPMSEAGGQLTLMHADGGGDFTQQLTIALPNDGIPMLGDVNGDDTLDVVVALGTAQAPFTLNKGASGVATLLGDGAGGLLAPLVSGGVNVSGPYSIGLLDVDGDGHLDANLGPCIAFGRGDGTFVGSAVNALGSGNLGTDPLGLAAADMNGDGQKDLVVARKNKVKGLAVLLGHGDASFDVNNLAAPGVVDVAVGDLDGDGVPDVAGIGSSALPGAKILLNDGSGLAFTAPSDALSFSPDDLALADLDGDGALDLLASHPAANELLLLPGDGHGGFLPAQSLDPHGAPDLVKALDLDGDGTLDIAATLTSQPSLTTFAGLGGGAFSAPQITPLPIQPDTLAFADLNGDGLLDVAVASKDFTVLGLHYLLAQAPGVFGPSTEIRDIFNVDSLQATDFDGDGLADLLVLHANWDLLFFRNLGATGLAPPEQTLVSEGQSLVLDDFNGDARPDAAVYSSSNDTVRVLPNLTAGFPSLGYQHDASFGMPHLFTTGAPVLNEKVSFTATGVKAPALGALFLGFEFAPTSLAGGTLVPSPDVMLPIRPDVPLTGRWPDLPAGTRLYAQAWFATGSEVAATNAIEAITP